MATSTGRTHEWFVSTNGSPSGNGSITNAWDLKTAFANTNAQSGDTVWLRNGTYTPSTASTNQWWSGYLNYYPGWYASSGGVGTNRVTYRSYTNEWAAIDGRVMMADSICFRNLEFFNSMKGIRYNTNDLSQNGDFNAVYAHFVQNGTNNQWINCLIHDIDDGGFGGGHGANTVRGCLLWYIGWNYREHVFYPMVSEFSGSICAWPLNRTVNNTVADYICNSNIIFGSGLQWQSGGPNGNGNVGESDTDINTGGNRGAVIGNVCISSVESFNGSVSPGSVISNNIFCAAQTPVNWGASSNAVFSYNTLYDNDYHGIVLTWGGSTPLAVDCNNYYATPNAIAHGDSVCFINLANQLGVSLGSWQTNYGFDLHSTTNLSAPPDSIRIMPNADQPKRCNIAVCNWSLKDNVNVNLSAVLNTGDTYQLYSAQNILAGPIQTGTYNGTSISIPMTNLTTAPILYGTNVNRWGEVVAQPPPMSPQFGAFVVIGSTHAPLPPNKFRVLSPP